MKSKPSLYEYMRRLQQWRDRYEKHLDARPRLQSLEQFSHYLTEFQYGKFDEVEVPGQYTEVDAFPQLLTSVWILMLEQQDKDSNQNFVRIQKFGPKVENYRTHGCCWRRLTVIGNDHSKTTFAIQTPSGRHSRREERAIQVFRTFNGSVQRWVDVRTKC